jgi:hypothetical protein
LGGGDIDDLLSPYDCEIKPYRGVKTPAGWEMVPQGVFELTARNVVGDGQVQLTGQDRAMIFQGGMPGQLAVNVGTPVEQAIQDAAEHPQAGPADADLADRVHRRAAALPGRHRRVGRGAEAGPVRRRLAVARPGGLPALLGPLAPPRAAAVAPLRRR